MSSNHGTPKKTNKAIALTVSLGGVDRNLMMINLGFCYCFLLLSFPSFSSFLVIPVFGVLHLGFKRLFKYDPYFVPIFSQYISRYSNNRAVYLYAQKSCVNKGFKVPQPVSIKKQFKKG